jgi:hypothetical protein
VAATTGTPIIGLLVAAVNRRADPRGQLEYQRAEARRQFELQQNRVSQMTRSAARVDWQPRRLLWERAPRIDVTYITQHQASDKSRARHATSNGKPMH